MRGAVVACWGRKRITCHFSHVATRRGDVVNAGSSLIFLVKRVQADEVFLGMACNLQVHYNGDVSESERQGPFG